MIPTILCRGRAMVKGKQFNAWRSVGLASQAVRVQAIRGVDEIMLLDISATPEWRGPDMALVEELAETVFCPLTVGGGIRSVTTVQALLRAGADSVVIGTAALEEPYLLQQLRDSVGSQAVVVSVDVRGGEVYTRCGKNPVQRHPIEWAETVQRWGAGEILLTSIDREGTLDGYDLELIRKVAKFVDVPLVANGGCGSYEDMARAIDAGADAVAAGAFFQFTDGTPKEAALYLQQHGIEARV